MRLLVLGGSWFLGAEIVRAALSAQWDVSVFHRGRSGIDVTGATPIHGDRTSARDLVRLSEAGRWDAVVDTSGYVPADVGRVARSLSKVATRYVFVSTVSVYQDWPVIEVDEGSVLRECAPDRDTDDGSAGDPGPMLYGAFKAGAERAVLDAFGDQAVLIRPGVIIGPGEYVGRVPWWLRRFERGGVVLGPGAPDATIQPVDVRDVADFVVQTLLGPAGAYNVTGDDTTFGQFLAACHRTSSAADAVVEWITDTAWLAARVTPWVETPFWHSKPAAWSVSSRRARSVGLVTRPMADTVADVWAWMRAGGRAVDHPRAGLVGLSAAKEADLLAAWRERRATRG